MGWKFNPFLGTKTKLDYFQPSGKVSLSGAFYLGDASVDGTWRIIRDGDNLSVQRRESGVWVEKSSFLPA